MVRGAPKLEADEEAALLQQIRSGSRAQRDAAYARLLAAIREPVLALCLQITGSRADAEDALQNSLMAVYRGLVGFRGDARLLTWAYRIAVREALRQKGARAGETGLDDEPPAPESGDPALRRERVEQLRRAFDRLSADHRAVLSLFAIDGLSHREIADILKVPEGTIWSRLHKARKRLADEMAQLEAGPAPANGSASASSAIRARRAGRRQSRHASPALRIAARTWRHLGDLRRPSLRRGLGASRRAAASLAPAKFENSAAPG